MMLSCRPRISASEFEAYRCEESEKVHEVFGTPHSGILLNFSLLRLFITVLIALCNYLKEVLQTCIQPCKTVQ
jgi:hypothetical protein